MMVRHNAEIAHRLSQSPGKCQQIHGHGLQIELVLLELAQDLETGMAKDREGNILDFSAIKKSFRAHIDEDYDHHLLLNERDDWAQNLYFHGEEWENGVEQKLPGLKTFPGDPTVENLCKWIALWAAESFHVDVICRIAETRTNGAEVMAIYGNREAIVR